MKPTNRPKTTSTAKGGPVDCTTRRPTVFGPPIKGADHEQVANPAAAEFFRPCAPRGRCPVTGLSRTALINAADACGALVRLRLKNKLRGAVLIHRETLTEYLRSLAASGKGDA